MKKILVALFDLDGVVFHTEPQYSEFWRTECMRYEPDKPDLYLQIKGQTLEQILSNYLSGYADEHEALIERLDDYERRMAFEYVAGFKRFVKALRKLGVQTAVVTSSNRKKMEHIYRQHPDFKTFFDALFTSEDFSESKPSPMCYLKAKTFFGVNAEDCVVFEDSFNGLRAGRAAGMRVVGLSTTNEPELISPFADKVVPDFVDLDAEQLVNLQFLNLK